MTAKILRVFEDRELYFAEVELAGGDTKTVDIYTPSGVTSLPLPGDKVELLKREGEGGYRYIAVLDRAPEIMPGEVHTFARDEAGTRVSSSKYLQSGRVEHSAEESILFQVGGSSLEIMDGKILLNGVEIDTGGNISTSGGVEATGDVLSGGISLQNHTHQAPSGGGPTSPPLPSFFAPI